MTQTLHAVGGEDSTSSQAESNVRGVVRMILAARDIGKDSLAATLGISRASLYERLNGRRAFTVGEVATMAKAFEVPVSIFFSGPNALLLGSDQSTIGSWFPTFGDVPVLSEAAA